MVEDLWDSVVGKHGQFINVVELSQTLPLELPIYIANKYLCSFVQVNLLPLVDCMILHVGEVLG